MIMLQTWSSVIALLTLDKVAAFKEICRILRSNGRMIISDLVTSREVELVQNYLAAKAP
jgi:ubiquinone/menaquinone biosynthesis C-methylase UbiE